MLYLIKTDTIHPRNFNLQFWISTPFLRYSLHFSWHRLDVKQSNSLLFRSFKPLARHASILEQIEERITVRDYEAALKLSERLRSLALEGLHYFQTYDWLMLMTVIALGYIGWMVYLILHVLQSYTSLPGVIVRKEQVVQLSTSAGKVMSMQAPLYLQLKLEEKRVGTNQFGTVFWSSEKKICFLKSSFWKFLGLPSELRINASASL